MSAVWLDYFRIVATLDTLVKKKAHELILGQELFLITWTLQCSSWGGSQTGRDATHYWVFLLDHLRIWFCKMAAINPTNALPDNSTRKALQDSCLVKVVRLYQPHRCQSRVRLSDIAVDADMVLQHWSPWEKMPCSSDSIQQELTVQLAICKHLSNFSSYHRQGACSGCFCLCGCSCYIPFCFGPFSTWCAGILGCCPYFLIPTFLENDWCSTIHQTWPWLNNFSTKCSASGINQGTSMGEKESHHWVYVFAHAPGPWNPL